MTWRMPDGNTAALRQKMDEDDRRERDAWKIKQEQEARVAHMLQTADKQLIIDACEYLCENGFEAQNMANGIRTNDDTEVGRAFRAYLEGYCRDVAEDRVMGWDDE